MKMPSAHLSLKEEDVIKLTLEFLQNRDLHITQLSLERETGVINGCYSDDLLFLRQLILDGQWDDAVEFTQPLESIEQFDKRRFRYLILKHKYVELLCIKSEAGAVPSTDAAVEEVVKVLNELEHYCVSKEDYSNLCLLLTLPKLSDHLDYRDWNPSSARVQCFKSVLPLVENYLPSNRKNINNDNQAKCDRLMQLIIKGLLYESCVDYCQQKATCPSEETKEMSFSKLLSGNGFSDSDLSLLSWLQSIPFETFSCPFEQKTLNVDVERMDKPCLEASWTEHMLVTPIKPNIFPHSAMPHTRPRSTDIMSKSLLPSMEGLPYGLGMTRSVTSAGFKDVNIMSKSFASFHLSNKKAMTTSVDKLFEDADVASSGSHNELPSISESPLKEEQAGFHATTKPEDKLIDSINAKTSDSVLDLVSSRGDLLKEFSKQKRYQDNITRHINFGPNQIIPPRSHSQPTQFEPLRPTMFDGRPNYPAPPYAPPRYPYVAGNPTPIKNQQPPPVNGTAGKPHFIPVTTLEDVQAVRCAEFHPFGKLYAVGSNSKTLRICSYPKLSDLRSDHQTYPPTVLFKRTKHHKGSIYCLAWSPVGDLVATGSNDKTIKLMRFNSDTCNMEGQEIELTMHDGTVRDLCFIEDMSNKSSLLVSGGAGDCKIYITDCATGTPFQAMTGHSGHILTLYTWGGAMFLSGSQDRTVRFWDLRSRGCVNVISPQTMTKSSPVAAACVDPSGRLLVTGHEDSSCVLYDIRGARGIQCFKPHSADIRTIRFSPNAYYLLTGGYDNKLVLTDLQGDLTMPLPSVIVAEHQDKVISGRWHPQEFSFISTSADKTSTLWALPPL